MKIYLGTDHAGFALKESITGHLLSKGYDVIDLGAHAFVLDDDYPDYVHPVARYVSEDPDALGIIFGGSGQGEAMCANKTPGVRAAVFYGQMLPKDSVDKDGAASDDPYEIVRLAREHNNANILSLGARFITTDEALEAVTIFIETLFGADERHVRRITKIESY